MLLILLHFIIEYHEFVTSLYFQNIVSYYMSSYLEMLTIA